MTLHVFAVYDSKAEAFLPPFFAPKTALAIRMFSEAANTEDHNFSKHAADFTLFHFGSFDPETGKFDLLSAHENLGTALQHLDSSTH